MMIGGIDFGSEIIHKIMIQERCFLDLEGSIESDNRDPLP